MAVDETMCPDCETSMQVIKQGEPGYTLEKLGGFVFWTHAPPIPAEALATPVNVQQPPSPESFTPPKRSRDH